MRSTILPTAATSAWESEKRISPQIPHIVFFLSNVVAVDGEYQGLGSQRLAIFATIV
jgi:hypothetical protein